MKTSYVNIATLFQVVFAIGTLAPALAQQPQTVESFLLEHHVDNSVSGLRKAIKDQDPFVRGVASGLLAQRKDMQSVPLLEAALQQEPNLSTQVAIAGALVSLDDRKGLIWLTSKCGESTETPVGRMVAANRLLELGHNDCLASVLDILGARPGIEGTSLGLQYLRRASDPPEADLIKLRSQLNAALQDPLPQNRWDASRVLAVVGGVDSIEPLKRAISAEKDNEFRHRLEDALRKLQARVPAS